MVLGLGPIAFQSPNHFSITALASSGETSPMTTMVVRSGLMVAAKYCFTWSKLILARVAGVTSRRTGSPAGNKARSSAREVRYSGLFRLPATNWEVCCLTTGKASAGSAG